MSLIVAREILNLIQFHPSTEIKEILSQYSFEQRKFILSTDICGSTLLYHAVFHCRYTVVTYFLDKCGADPNRLGIKENQKCTCLAEAVSLNSQNMVNLLLSRGADINAVSYRDRTAVTVACSLRKLEMAAYLVECGANISIQNSNGNDTLMESLHNFNIFKYLVIKGADINLVDAKGITVLMYALRTHRNRIVSFLLSRDNINVRLKNGLEEDALNLAIRTSNEATIESIIRRGNYTLEELIRIYELESCHASVSGKPLKSQRLWKRVLELRGLPEDTRLFDINLPSIVSDDDIPLLDDRYTPALLYLKSLCGPRHVLKIRSLAIALSSVYDVSDMLKSYKLFFEILDLLSVGDFFQIHHYVEDIFTHYFVGFEEDDILMRGFFEIFRHYTHILFEKLEQPMTDSIRNLSDARMKEYVYYFINLIPFLLGNFQPYTDEINSEIKSFVRTYFKKSSITRSILQICFKKSDVLSFRILLSCEADVNETDDNNESIIHYLLDSLISCKRELIQSVMDGGFDFSLVTSKKYCLPCRIKKEGIDVPSESNTLRCMAANVICQRRVFALTNLPKPLRIFIQMHLHLP